MADSPFVTGGGAPATPAQPEYGSPEYWNAWTAARDARVNLLGSLNPGATFVTDNGTMNMPTAEQWAALPQDPVDTRPGPQDGISDGVLGFLGLSRDQYNAMPKNVVDPNGFVTGPGSPSTTKTPAAPAAQTKVTSPSPFVTGPSGTPLPEYKLPDIQQLQVAKMATSIAPNFNAQQVGADSMKAPVATGGNYASNLIRSLRSAGAGTGSSNPGVKMMPNQPNMDSAINILRAPPSGLAFNPPKLTLGGTGTTPVHTPTGFDWQAYLKYNPDLVASGINTEQAARDHYNNYGYKEGRRLGPTSNVDDWNTGKLFDKSSIPADFDWQAYLMLNPALAQAGIDTQVEAMRHYAMFGKAENRPYQTASDPWISNNVGS